MRGGNLRSEVGPSSNQTKPPPNIQDISKRTYRTGPLNSKPEYLITRACNLTFSGGPLGGILGSHSKFSGWKTTDFRGSAESIFAAPSDLLGVSPWRQLTPQPPYHRCHGIPKMAFCKRRGKFAQISKSFFWGVTCEFSDEFSG